MGLLSGRTVCDSRWRGLAPTSDRKRKIPPMQRSDDFVGGIGGKMNRVHCGAVNFYGNRFTVVNERSTDPSIQIAAVYFDLCQCGKGRWIIGFDELIQFQTGDPHTVQIKPLSFGCLLQG